MIRTIYLLMFAMVAASAVGLYNVKYRAEAQRREIASLERQIAEEEEAIQVLRAEFSYLTQPERLESLSSRHLQLKPLDSSQIATFADLPMPPHDGDYLGPNGRLPLGGYAGTVDSGGTVR